MTRSSEHFVEAFVEGWARRDPSAFPSLFRPDALIDHPTVSEPVRGEDVARLNARFHRALPDLSFRALSHATSVDLAFIEFECNATWNGQPLQWRGVDRFALRQGKVSAAAAYFDTLPLWSVLDPSMARPGILEGAEQLDG